MTAKIGDVGTLRELDVKPGDVVGVQSTWCGEHVPNGEEWIIKRGDGTWMYGVKPNYKPDHIGVKLCNGTHFRLISHADQATTQPTIWRDLSPEEKGALLLAAHEGRTIGVWSGSHWQWCDGPHKNGVYFDSVAYMVKPEPVRETVKIYGSGGYWTQGLPLKHPETHRITFDTIDGVPDCNSVKMEAI